MANVTTIYRAANLPSQNLGGVTGQQTVLDQRGNTLALQLPTNGSLDTVSFHLQVAGHGLMTATHSTTLILYVGTAANPTAQQLLSTTHNLTATAGQGTAHFVCDLFWPSATKNITGIYYGYYGGAALANTLTSTVTGADPNQDSNNQSGAPLIITATMNFATAAAGETFVLDVLELKF